MFSFLDLANDEIAIGILVDALVFEKSLMYEHFNDNYTTSILYPKTTFGGKFIVFDKFDFLNQTIIVEEKLILNGGHTMLK